MTKTLRKCVAFASWCGRWNLHPSDAADLLTICRRAFAAGEREANTGRSADPQRRRVETKAKEMGMSVTWPGLWPILHKRGQDIYLPEVG